MRTLFLETFAENENLKIGYKALINEADKGNASLNFLFNELELAREKFIKEKYPIKYKAIITPRLETFSFRLNTNHLISSCPFTLIKKYYNPEGFTLNLADTYLLSFFVSYKSFLNYRTKIKNEELIKVKEENLKDTVNNLISKNNLTKMKHDLSSFNLDDNTKELMFAIKNAADMGLKEESTLISSYMEYLNAYKFYLLIKE